MEGRYSVFQNEKVIGEVDVSRQGLYYRFFCRCNYHGDNFCRLMIQLGDTEVSLGIMVPEGPEFILEKRLPVKKFGMETPVFYIPYPKDPSPEGMFVPISKDEPFLWLTKLRKAFLIHHDGRVGAWIPEKD